VATTTNIPKGGLDGPRQAFEIGANDQLFTAEAFADVVVAYRNGSPVLLRQVGQAGDGAGDGELAAWPNGAPAGLVGIHAQPGANGIEVADAVTALLAKLRTSLPPSLKIAVVEDRTTSVRASIADVKFTLALTVALVVMVIFLFLRKLWATVIPSVALPVSLIATFGL